MLIVKTISLLGHIPAGKHLTLLSVDVGEDLVQPLVCAQYALDGRKQKLGLRLDLDKRVSLDRFDDAEIEAEAGTAVRQLCEFLGTAEAEALVAAATPIVVGANVRRSPPLPASRSAYSD